MIIHPTYCSFMLGSNKPDRNRWGFGWGLEDGWMSLFEKSLRPAYEFGFRRFLLHRPFGESDRHDHMDFDAKIDIQEAGHDLPQYDAAEITRFMRRVSKEMADARITVYMGSIHDDSFKDITVDEFLDRMQASLCPWGDFDIDLAVDNTSSPVHYPPDSEWWAASELLRHLIERRGGTYWLEAVPWIDQPEKRHHNAMCLERYWLRNYWNIGHRPGKLMRLMNGHSAHQYSGDMVAWLADTIRCGHYGCLDWGIARGIEFDSLNDLKQAAYGKAIGK